MKRKYNIINTSTNKVVKSIMLCDRQAFSLLYAQAKAGVTQFGRVPSAQKRTVEVAGSNPASCTLQRKGDVEK